MERVAFLVESTGERLGCLLNPENIELSRSAGVRRRHSATGLLTGAALSEDPILYTGGGRTDLNLDLLFDIGVAGSTIETSDVRDLTRPLWQLAETAQEAGTGAPAPIVRFLWGKSWNVPGVVTAVAERLEQFEADGMPARSWLRMRLARVSDADSQATAPAPGTEPTVLGEEEGETTHPVIGEEGGERLEQIAYRHYGDPGAWRTIADANALTDPARLAPGTRLRIPPPSAERRRA
jgi:Contractile injection system tube protein